MIHRMQSFLTGILPRVLFFEHGSLGQSIHDKRKKAKNNVPENEDSPENGVDLELELLIRLCKFCFSWSSLLSNKESEKRFDLHVFIKKHMKLSTLVCYILSCKQSHPHTSSCVSSNLTFKLEFHNP